ncbi:MAG: hypothetical protein LQ342_008435 [Letrouitia transgressa]|nr:MAG: hypothetical protein LQ342_008435 [Letrouitia transgressa]
MAGVGEVSAIVALAALATQLSKAVIDVASKYKAATAQIESFGNEVEVLGGVISQLSRLLNKDPHELNDAGLESITCSILDQCRALFGELETYKEGLYGNLGSSKGKHFWVRAKWVFQATELQYLRARVDSMKINMLLMMSLQMSRIEKRYARLGVLPLFIVVANRSACRKSAGPGPSLEDDQIESLSFQSDTCVTQLQILEMNLIAPLAEDSLEMNRLSIGSLDFSSTARSIRNSILSFYGRESYYAKILAPRETSFYSAQESRFDFSRASQVIEDYLNFDLAKNPSNSELFTSGSENAETSADPSGLNTQDTTSTVDAKHSGRIKDYKAGKHNKHVSQTLEDIPSRQIPSLSDDERSATNTPSSPSATHNIMPGVRSNAKVENSRVFRISMDSPCSEVLPAALKDYNIDTDPRNFNLFIVFGENREWERCLEMDEKPLMISKRLKREGEKPLFMLRPTPFSDQRF